MYCSVAFHSSLTILQSNKLEMIQKVSLKIILHDSYIGYKEACEMTGLLTLYNRHQLRMLKFAEKCVKHPQNSRLFPYNEQYSVNPHIRDRELYKVNFSHGEKYRKSAVPTMQRLLNDKH